MSHTNPGRGLASLLAVLVIAASSGEAAARTNVVLVIADYMGYHDIEPYGADDIATPSLERLAAGGIRMTDFYSAAPVCGPARAALYTGRYPAATGFEQNIRSNADGLSASIPSLPRWLKDAGYRTALFGKWHLGYGPDFGPNAHGFDEFFGHHEWTISYYSHETETGEPGLWENDRLVDENGYLTDLLSDRAVRFIDQNRERPFFLTLAYNAALPPYQPPGLPESRWDEGWDVNKASRSDYVGMVEAMDAGIGRVLDALDRDGLSDDTLVIFLYDHGGRHLVNSEPFFNGFANLWEGGIRVPLIMRLPGMLPAGATSGLPSIAMDVTATILAAAGLGDIAAKMDGTDLVPLLTDKKAPPQRRLCWRADLYDFGAQRAVREGRWKFMQHDSTQFLFDITEDPGERRNLFYEHPDIVNRLRTADCGW